MRLVRDKRGQYQNSIETERDIKIAFIFLMQEKDLDTITVSDIARRAGIERSTFYSHFEDIDYLVMDLVRVLLHDIKQKLESDERGVLASLPAAIWCMVTKVKDFPYEQISKSSYWLPFSYAMIWAIMDILVTDRLITDDAEMLDRNKIRLDHFLGGIMSTLHAWNNERLECSEEDLIAVLTEMALQFVQTLRSNKSE